MTTMAAAGWHASPGVTTQGLRLPPRPCVSEITKQPSMYEALPRDPNLVLTSGRYVWALNGQGFDFAIEGKITDKSQCWSVGALSANNAAQVAVHSLHRSGLKRPVDYHVLVLRRAGRLVWRRNTLTAGFPCRSCGSRASASVRDAARSCRVPLSRR